MASRHHPRTRRRRSVTWNDLPPTIRVKWVEHILSHIVPTLHPERQPGRITPDTRAVLDQTHHGIVDDSLHEGEFDVWRERAFAHIYALPPDERDEAVRQDMDFVMVVLNMPWDATCPGDWFHHVAAHGLVDPNAEDGA